MDADASIPVLKFLLFCLIELLLLSNLLFLLCKQAVLWRWCCHGLPLGTLSIKSGLPSSICGGLIWLSQQLAFLKLINCACSNSLLHHDPSYLALATRSHQFLVLIIILLIWIESSVVSAIAIVYTSYSLACRYCSDPIEYNCTRGRPISRCLITGWLVRLYLFAIL